VAKHRALCADDVRARQADVVQAGRDAQEALGDEHELVAAALPASPRVSSAPPKE
jgi:hypothetical protein